MKLYKEENIRDFDFWGGAADRVKYLTDDEMDAVESILEDLYPDGMSETDHNDLFWFDDDTIADWLGYDDFDTVMNRDEVPA